MFNYVLKYSNKMSGFQSLNLSCLKRYASSGGRYEIDPHRLSVLISSLSQYVTTWSVYFEKNGYKGGDTGNYSPACYILAGTGNDKAIYLLVPTIDWSNETGIEMVILATLIMGHEISFRIEEHGSILVDPEALHEIGKELKRQTTI